MYTELKDLYGGTARCYMGKNFNNWYVWTVTYLPKDHFGIGYFLDLEKDGFGLPSEGYKPSDFRSFDDAVMHAIVYVDAYHNKNKDTK